jgi:RNA polymerase sigma-70 factor (ECF subfamily)
MDYSSLSAEEVVRVCVEEGTRQAWEEFVRRFNPLIARVVLRTARRWVQPSKQLLDDLVQDTYLKFCADNCRLLRTFEVRQPDAVYGYIKTVTANVVHDHFKAAHAMKRGAGRAEESADPYESGIEPIAESRGTATAKMDREVLIQQIDQHLARIVPPSELARNRLIFWLYYRTGLSASAIAGMPGMGLSTKGVESAILRMTRELRAVLVESPKVPADESGGVGRHEKGITSEESFR